MPNDKGSKPLSDALETAASWLHRTSAELGRSGLVQDDIDEIVDLDSPGRFGLVAFELLGGVLDVMIADGNEAVAMLVLPLEPTADLATTSPKVEEVIRGWWEPIRVPGLYLLDSIGRLDFADPYEDYRLPLDAVEVNQRHQASCLYRVFRSLESRERGWAYDRAIYLWAQPVQRTMPGDL